jgi:hypothetical protein
VFAKVDDDDAEMRHCRERIDFHGVLVKEKSTRLCSLSSLSSTNISSVLLLLLLIHGPSHEPNSQMFLMMRKHLVFPEVLILCEVFRMLFRVFR